MTTTTTRYLSAADTAKLVRQALKAKFPGIAFSVRTSTYSGGASVRVGWTDGPRTPQVEAVTKQYEGGGFDGSIDLPYNITHYLRPDGSTYVMQDPGTLGSGGAHQGQDNRALAHLMPEGVQAVSFGADSVYCDRTISNEEAETTSAVQWVYAHCTTEGGTGNPNIDRFGNDLVIWLAQRMVRDSIKGEDWEASYQRRMYR